MLVTAVIAVIVLPAVILNLAIVPAFAMVVALAGFLIRFSAVGASAIVGGVFVTRRASRPTIAVVAAAMRAAVSDRDSVVIRMDLAEREEAVPVAAEFD